MSRLITDAPVWVWPLLAVLIWWGLRNLNERAAPVWTLAILPLAGLALAPSRIMRAPDAAIALAIYVFCVAAALPAGLWAAQGIKAGYDRAHGRLSLPGSSFTLILSLSIFLVYYAFGVAFGINPRLAAHRVIGVLPIAVGGMLVGFILGRQGLLLARYLRS